MKKSSLNRNNTDFPLKLTSALEALIALKSDKSKGAQEADFAFLKYHQNLIRHFVAGVALNSADATGSGRGLLLYHQMGTGKTLQAIAIAMEYVDENRATDGGRDIVVILPKSLRDNFKESINKYVRMRAAMQPGYWLARLSPADLGAWVAKKFSFVTLMASNMVSQIGSLAANKASVAANADLDLDFGAEAELDVKFQKVVDAGSLSGKIVIVDEAQNLFRAITNGSKGGTNLYNLIMAAEDIKLFLLSGTPISTNPFETVACFNMLAGARVLPESYEEFKKYFVDSKAGTIINKGKYQNRIMGLASYVGNMADPKSDVDPKTKADSADKKAAADDALAFPTELETKILYVPMNPRQYGHYLHARDKERAEAVNNAGFGRKGPAAAMSKPKSGKSSSYRQRSRQMGNWSPPGHLASLKFSEIDVAAVPDAAIVAGSPKFDTIWKTITEQHAGQLAVVYSQFAGAGGLSSFMQYLKIKGAKMSPLLAGLDVFKALGREEKETVAAPPDAIIDGAADAPEPATTEDATEEESKAEAAESISAAASDVSALANKNRQGPTVQGLQPTGVTFAIISGSVPADIRTAVLAAFNSPENSCGAAITVLLITRTGAEGLDLKRVRAIFVLEPTWTYSLISQIKARGIRSGSHVDMAPECRNVRPYVLIATRPDMSPAEEIIRAAVVGDRIVHELDANILREVEASSSVSLAKAGTVGGPPKTQPDDKYAEELMTTDMTLYYECLRERVLIESFLDAIKEASIECSILGHAKALGLTCRTCSPNNVPLWTDSLERDIIGPDPCSLISEKKTTVKSINFVDPMTGIERKYFYAPDMNSVYGYSFFEYSKTLNKYVAANVAPIVDKLLLAIKK
jgi:SNF2-related domain/Helicase conserved C-terminal domain